MATLTITDVQHHMVLHGKIWRVDLAQSYSGNMGTIAVPFRVPSGIPQSGMGMLRLHNSDSCQLVQVQQEGSEEKCPSHCGLGHCIQIPFRLTSPLRQIVLLTDQTDYKRGDNVHIRYQPLDESTRPKDPPLLNIWITDPTNTRLHTWQKGQLQTVEKAEDKFFRQIVYPLGDKCACGKWTVCASSSPEWTTMGKDHDCVEFIVEETAAKRDGDDDKEDVEEGFAAVQSMVVDDGGLISEQHFVKLEFGPDMRRTFRPRVPVSGKLMATSSENEVEVMLRLLNGEDGSVIDQQTLYLNNEAIFEFAPVDSTINQLIIEAQLVSTSPEAHQDNLLITTEDAINEDDTRLIIDEVDKPQEEEEEEEDKLSYVLASVVLQQEKQSLERYNEPLWTSGLERTFKTGDFATVTVSSLSSESYCESGLNWVVARGGQYVAWGQERPEVGLQRRDKNNNNNILLKECVYKIGLEINARMAPMATFKAWKSSSVPSGIITYDEQNFTVSLEDRALIIVELNTTEVSHSLLKVGVEVFAEPSSVICLMGSSKQDAKTEVAEATGLDDDDDAASSTSNTNAQQAQKDDKTGASSSQTDNRHMRPFAPTKNTWFFQCGNTSEDGFFTTWVKAPVMGGQWTVEAASLSPFHGLRLAEARSLLRTKPIHVHLVGLPPIFRRGEVLPQVGASIRNNMPVPLQLTIILTASSGLHFGSINGLHYDTHFTNASGYEKVVSSHKIFVGNGARGHKNVSVHVTAVAFIEDHYIEVDSVHVSHEFMVLPRGERVEKTTADYFCGQHQGQKSLEDDDSSEERWQIISPAQPDVSFSIVSDEEVIFTLLDNQQEDELLFKLAVGSQDNSVSWLSVTKKGHEFRLQTVYTPDILNVETVSNFWLEWGQDSAHQRLLKFGQGNKTGDDGNILLTWPLPPTFVPQKIGVRNIPGSNTDIRFWREGQQQEEGKSNGGHNRIFRLLTDVINATAVNGTLQAHLTMANDLYLPQSGSLSYDDDDDGHKDVGPKCLTGLMNNLRDTATMSQMERIHRVPKGTYTSPLMHKLHEATQDLLYFRNVDGSFGEPLVKQGLDMALEQYFLLTEIEAFFGGGISPFLMEGLERWILEQSKQKLQENNADTARDILEWAPKDTKIYKQLSRQSYQVLNENLANVENELGLVGMMDKYDIGRSVSALVRAPHSAEERLFVDRLFDTFWQSSRLQRTQCESSNWDVMVSALLAASNLASHRHLDTSHTREIFRCVHQHASEILAMPKIGYRVVRALSGYYRHLGDRLSNAEQNLKISVATSADLTQSKTWHFQNGSDVHYMDLGQPVPEKLFFLATGSGCASLQISTTYETFETEPNGSLYQVSIDINEELDTTDNLYLTMCIGLSINSAQTEPIPTTVMMEMFTGFTFQTLVNVDHNIVQSHKNQFLLIHLKEVKQCGTCFALKFHRDYKVDNLAPGKLILFPTSEALSKKKDKRSTPSKIYFHLAQNAINSTATDGPQWADRKPGDQLVSSTKLSEVCPCNSQCEPITTTTTTTTTTSTTTTTTTTTTTPTTTTTTTTTSTTTTTTSSTTPATTSTTTTSKKSKSTVTTKTTTTTTTAATTEKKKLEKFPPPTFSSSKSVEKSGTKESQQEVEETFATAASSSSNSKVATTLLTTTTTTSAKEFPKLDTEKYKGEQEKVLPQTSSSSSSLESTTVSVPETN